VNDQTFAMRALGRREVLMTWRFYRPGATVILTAGWPPQQGAAIRRAFSNRCFETAPENSPVKAT
jgi:hypothetical protein